MSLWQFAFRVGFVLSWLLLGAQVAFSQVYPHKPIRIVTVEPGGTTDFAARIFAQEFTASLGQQTIVENRATGIIAAETVAKAQPDGYTMLLQGSILWLGPLLQKMPYDAVRDFSPVSLTNTAPNILAVNPSLPVKSVNDLIALAKAKPGELNYGSGATGASNHLAAELFKSLTGVNIVRVTYKGSGPIITALLSGEIQLTFGTAASVQSLAKSGKLRAIAVTSQKPSELAPGLPPIAATVPGYEFQAIYGIFVPAKTPTAIIDLLHREIARAVQKPGVREKFLNAGVETVANSPQEFANIIKADLARMSKVVKDAGIRSE